MVDNLLPLHSGIASVLNVAKLVAWLSYLSEQPEKIILDPLPRHLHQ